MVYLREWCDSGVPKRVEYLREWCTYDHGVHIVYIQGLVVGSTEPSATKWEEYAALRVMDYLLVNIFYFKMSHKGSKGNLENMPFIYS